MRLAFLKNHRIFACKTEKKIDMKTLFGILLISAAIVACNNDTESAAKQADSTVQAAADTVKAAVDTAVKKVDSVVNMAIDSAKSKVGAALDSAKRAIKK